MTTTQSYQSSEARRRSSWRARLGDRGLVEKKITIRGADSALFGEIAVRTRSGESLGDILFQLAATAAPPPAPLPPSEGATPGEHVIVEAPDPAGADLFAFGCAAAADEVSTYPSPFRYPAPRIAFKAVSERAGHALGDDAWRCLPFANAGVAAAEAGRREPDPVGPLELGLDSSPSERAGDDRPGADAPVVREEAGPSGVEEPLVLCAPEAPLPASWRRAAAPGPVERLLTSASSVGDAASRSISPPLFFTIAVALALAIASVVIYALKAPTVEAGPLQPFAHDERSQAIGSSSEVETVLRVRLEGLEAENRRLADHLDALLAERADDKAASPLPQAVPERHRHPRKGASSK